MATFKKQLGIVKKLIEKYGVDPNLTSAVVSTLLCTEDKDKSMLEYFCYRMAFSQYT